MKFEEFLQQKHTEQYRGTDDEMQEDYMDWLADLEIETVINYAEEWKEETQ